MPWQGVSRLWSVPLIALVCAGLAALVSVLVPPQYSATARLVASAGAPDEPAADRAAADQVYARTFVELLGSEAVAERVAARLPFQASPAEVAQQTSFSAVEGTAVIEVTAEGPDPRRAADLATTWAEVSAEEGVDVLGVRDATLTLASPAPVPSTPERPRPLLYSGVAAAAGALLGALVALTTGRRQRTDERGPGHTPVGPGRGLPGRRWRLRTLVASRPSWLAAGAALAAAAAVVPSADLRVLPGPVGARVVTGLLLGALVGALLAVVALVLYDRIRGLVLLSEDAAQATGADIVVQTTEPRRLHVATGIDMRFRDLEPYRMLYQALAERPDSTVVMAVDGSAGAGSGLRSIDVAVAGANAGARTVLVGANVQGHRRAVSEVLRRALDDDAALDHDLLPTDRPHLRVLPLDWSGAAGRRGRAALGSRQLPLLVERLRTRADFIVFCSPPLSEPEIPLRLAEVAEASLLVVAAGYATVRDCRRVADRLARAGSRVTAVVLVHHGRRQPTPVIWTRPPRATRGAGPPSPDPRPADDPGEATALASAVRNAGVGSGRARNAPAPRTPEHSQAAARTAPARSDRAPAEGEP